MDLVYVAAVRKVVWFSVIAVVVSSDDVGEVVQVIVKWHRCGHCYHVIAESG